MKAKILGNGPVLDEKCLFVRVLGVSGTVGEGDSTILVIAQQIGKQVAKDI